MVVMLLQNESELQVWRGPNDIYLVNGTTARGGINGHTHVLRLNIIEDDDDGAGTACMTLGPAVMAGEHTRLEARSRLNDLG